MASLLLHICENAVMSHVIDVLRRRKRRIGRWIVSHEEWLALMDVDSMLNWLRGGLIPSLTSSTLQSGIDRLTGARDRDVMTCLFVMQVRSIGDNSDLTLPKCLKSDEAARLFCLQVLDAQSEIVIPRLRRINLACYRGFGAAPYVSDAERALTASLLANGRNLLSLAVPTVADVYVLQAIAGGCPKLAALDVSGSAKVDDECVLSILSGFQVVVHRGPLTKCVRTGGEASVRRSLTSLDVSRTSVRRSSADEIKRVFLQLSALTFSN